MKKESWTLLWVWTAYVFVHECKWEMYVKLDDYRNSVENLRELNRKQSKAFKSAMRDYRELLRDYIKIWEENKKLNIIIENTKIEQKSDREHIEELEEENKVIKEEKEMLIRQKTLLQESNKKLKEKYNWLWDIYTRDVNERIEENKKLKSDLANIQCEFWFECDECEFWKREMKKHKPCLIKEEYVFNLWDYDYMILTSATPQLKIIKKNNKWDSTFTVR